MFSHIMVGANDVQKSKIFYDAVLGALGYEPAVMDDKGRCFYLTKSGVFALTKPIDGEAAMGMAALSVSQQTMRPQPMPGTLPVWRVVALLVKTLQVCVKAAPAKCIWPIYVIPTATSFALCIA